MAEVSFEDNLIQFSSSVFGILDNTQSICISPYSVTAAFMLVMIGAAGKSKEQISSALFKNSVLSEGEKLRKYKSLNNDLIVRAGKDIILATANRLFVNRNYKVQRQIRRKAWRYFGARIDRKDFTQPEKSATDMNKWVSEQTGGKIRDLVKTSWLNSNTILVIINAVYFRGTWETEFDPKNTNKEMFHVSKRRTIKVDMMKMVKKVPYVQTSSYSAISLPYKGNKFAMVFILPRKIDGLSEIEAIIRRIPGFFSTLASSFQDKKLNIYIPKFVIKAEINLREELPKLGVRDIFTGKANFSKLIKGQKGGIHVSRAVHQVFIEVNEKGTEGTAATAAVLSRGETFKADHPYLFYIRDIETGVILFIGRYKPAS